MTRCVAYGFERKQASTCTSPGNARSTSDTLAEWLPEPAFSSRSFAPTRSGDCEAPQRPDEWQCREPGARHILHWQWHDGLGMTVSCRSVERDVSTIHPHAVRNIGHLAISRPQVASRAGLAPGRRGDENGPVAHASVALPVGTVTFLLSDLEGSTRLWEEHPAIAGTSIDRQRELLHEGITRQRGALAVEQGEGDSVVGAFHRADDAVAAALDVQRALAAEKWPEGVTLRVRMALHTGHGELSEDNRYVGRALHRCARVRALAAGG